MDIRTMAQKTVTFRYPPPPYSSEGLRAFWRGFTLAEVLITLTIIGIIAAMTVPTLMRKYQEHQTVAAVKAAYSILNNAFKMAVAENGPESNWDVGQKPGSLESSQKLANYIMPYLKISKDCGGNRDTCFPPYKTQKSLDGGAYGDVIPNSGASYFVSLANGFSVSFAVHGNNERYIVVDINGLKKPNQTGIDTFLFLLIGNKLRPVDGKPLNGGLQPNVYHQCSKDPVKSNYQRYNGLGCTHWVLYKGNMDYLRRDVSAEWGSVAW